MGEMKQDIRLDPENITSASLYKREASEVTPNNGDNFLVAAAGDNNNMMVKVYPEFLLPYVNKVRFTSVIACLCHLNLME